MRVCVNEQPVDASELDGQTLEDLLDSLRRSGCVADDEVVARFAVPWQAEDMDRLAGIELDDVEEIAITTAGLRGYATRILADASGMLAVLKDATRSVAACLRGGDIKKGNADLFNLFDALHRFLACIYHVQNSCALSCGPVGASDELLAGLNAALEAVHAPQQLGQWAEVARQLEGKFLLALDRLGIMLDDMRGELKNATR
jgi:hypothetical protein